MKQRMRLTIPVAMVMALGVALVASPAEAKPAKVHAPVVVAASPTSITLRWSTVRGATKYDVSYAATPGKSRKASATARRTPGRSPKVTVRGLRANTMYCFSVRARKGASTGSRSQAMCKKTPPRRNNTKLPKVSVATFNICGVAKGCPAWSQVREDKLVEQLVALNADVLLLQEASGETLVPNELRIKKLGARLAPHGYMWQPISKAHGLTNNREVIYYRDSTFAIETYQRPLYECGLFWGDPLPDGVDTSGWVDGNGGYYEGHYYAYDPETLTYRIYENICRLSGEMQTRPERGAWRLGGGNTSAHWVLLRNRRSGKKYMFVSAHLTAGSSEKAKRWRSTQMANLLKLAKAEVGSIPIIIGGDFNSSRNSPSDAPRVRLERGGLFDTYDRSTTFTNAQFASYNGFRTTPTKSVLYGSSIDRIFAPNGFGVTDWKVVATTRNSKYLKPMLSDHNPVKVSLYLR